MKVVIFYNNDDMTITIPYTIAHIPDLVEYIKNYIKSENFIIKEIY